MNYIFFIPMNKQNKLRIIFLALVMVFASCTKDDPEIPSTALSITVVMPEAMKEQVSADQLNIKLTHASTGQTYEGTTNIQGVWEIKVEEGVYSFLVNGEKTYNTKIGDQNFEQTVNLNGVLENQSITGVEQTLEIPLFISVASQGWIFKEIYFTGSRTPAGGMYFKDKYFEIYNNTDSVLYADGISIGEADHVTSDENNRWESIMNDYFVTHVVYTIPGSGTNYPVQPGKSILIADVAIDHRTDNANSFDLSGADFEWYDDHALDVDVPEVPNLIKYFSYSASIWTPHNRGFRSYVIFRPKTGMDKFMLENEIQKVNPNGSTSIRYKVPNNSILDAVELGTPSDFQSKALSPSLDISYINCGDADEARFGKSIRRKVQNVLDGRVVYQDTNNSAVDFHSTVTPQPGVVNPD
jgi:hypothetical protein